MSVDPRPFVAGEERHLRLVPFGRNRFLRTAGIALFALAIRLVAPRTALAAPWPCDGGADYNTCPCCNNADCCENGCLPTWNLCPGGTHCWYKVIVGTGTYQCCDWIRNNGSGPYCICMKKICSCWT